MTKKIGCFLFYGNYICYRDGTIENYRTGKILYGTVTPKGYVSVSLHSKKIMKRYLVHRIVASLFLEKEKNKDFVNHKNLNKKDNRVENLEWVSVQENNTHYQLSSKSQDYKFSQKKLNVFDVLYITEFYKSGMCIAKISRLFKIDWGSINKIIKKKGYKKELSILGILGDYGDGEIYYCENPKPSKVFVKDIIF